MRKLFERLSERQRDLYMVSPRAAWVGHPRADFFLRCR